MNKIKKILSFELNWLGDILFSFPFIRAIRKAFPDAHITCAVVPQYKDLLINVPWIDDIIILSNKNGFLSLWEKLKFVSTIKKRKYDTCFLLKPSRTKQVMASLAGIPICYSPQRDEYLHRVDSLLNLTKAVGVNTSDNTYEYFIAKKDKQSADKILYGAGGGKRRIVAVNTGGNWPAKRWPQDNFFELIKKLLEGFCDVEIILTGAKKDIAFTEKIRSEVNNERCCALAGRTTLNELAAIFQRSVLVISADSGPLHLASAVGSSTIGLFGPTSHKITGTRGRGRNVIIYKEIGCKIPCYIKFCEKDYLCMKSITVDEVFQAAKEIIG